MKRQYASIGELIEAIGQESFDKMVEKHRKFGEKRCPAGEELPDGRKICWYAGKVDCGRPIVNSINHEENTHYCVDTQEYQH